MLDRPFPVSSCCIGFLEAADYFAKAWNFLSRRFSCCTHCTIRLPRKSKILQELLVRLMGIGKAFGCSLFAPHGCLSFVAILLRSPRTRGYHSMFSEPLGLSDPPTAVVQNCPVSRSL